MPDRRFAVARGGELWVPGGSILAAPFQAELARATVPDPQPLPGGQFRTFTSQAEFDAAKQITNPGDVVIATGTPGTEIEGLFSWRGSLTEAPANPASHGADGAPIVITCADGVTLKAPANNPVGFPTIDVVAAPHIDVIKTRIDGLTSGQSTVSAIRYAYCPNTAGSWARIHGNEILNMPRAHINVASFWNSPYLPSSYVDIYGNFIDGGGDIGRVDPWFAEGCYIGSGTPEWVDRTHHINFRYNHIRRVQSDAFEAKPGTTWINVLYNLMEDIDLHADITKSVPVGGLTLHYANSTPPGDITNVNSSVVGNRLYWVRTNPAWAGPQGTWVFPPLTVGYAGTSVESNIVWGGQAAYGIGVRSGVSYGSDPIRIKCNTADRQLLQIETGFGHTPNVISTGNIPDQATRSFVGPITGLADAGEGIGSGFALIKGSAQLPGAGCLDAAAGAPHLWPGALMEDQR